MRELHELKGKAFGADFAFAEKNVLGRDFNRGPRGALTSCNSGIEVRYNINSRTYITNILII